MNFTREQFNPICSKDEWRPAIMVPCIVEAFNAGKHVAATDGHRLILVPVSLCAEWVHDYQYDETNRGRYPNVQIVSDIFHAPRINHAAIPVSDLIDLCTPPPSETEIGPCEKCSGAGLVTCPKCRGIGEIDHQCNCGECDLEGRIECPECHGECSVPCTLCNSAAPRIGLLFGHLVNTKLLVDLLPFFAPGLVDVWIHPATDSTTAIGLHCPSTGVRALLMPIRFNKTDANNIVATYPSP